MVIVPQVMPLADPKNPIGVGVGVAVGTGVGVAVGVGVGVAVGTGVGVGVGGLEGVTALEAEDGDPYPALLPAATVNE